MKKKRVSRIPSYLVPEVIEAYAETHSVPERKWHKALAKATRSNTQMPRMMVGSLEGAFLRMLVRLTKAERILEVGTFTGYSALAMAEALPAHGRLITCDVNPETSAIAHRFWKQVPFGRRIEQRLGPASETIRHLSGSFDLVFIDADKENYQHYWDLCLPKVRRGGLLVVDNVLWSGRVLQPKDASDRAIVAFNKYVRNDSRVEAVMTTIRDGVTLAWKK